MKLRFLAMLFVMAAAPLAAHPHVWADVQAEITVAGGYIDGVWSVWTFDEVFSQLILADHDSDGNGKIDSAENLSLKKGYFDNLKTYQFFTHLGLGGKELPVPEPQKFLATVTAGGRVSYRFYLPLALRLDAKTPLAVSFYDDSFFTDMVFLKKSPVVLQVTDGGRATVSLQPDRSKTFYGGQVTPTYAVVLWSPS